MMVRVRERRRRSGLWPIIERQKRVSTKFRVESDEQDFLDSGGAGGPRLKDSSLTLGGVGGEPGRGVSANT